jgi:hypothetical protein
MGRGAKQVRAMRAQKSGSPLFLASDEFAVVKCGFACFVRRSFLTS